MQFVIVLDLANENTSNGSLIPNSFKVGFYAVHLIEERNARSVLINLRQLVNQSRIGEITRFSFGFVCAWVCVRACVYACGCIVGWRLVERIGFTAVSRTVAKQAAGIENWVITIQPNRLGKKFVSNSVPPYIAVHIEEQIAGECLSGNKTI